MATQKKTFMNLILDRVHIKPRLLLSGCIIFQFSLILLQCKNISALPDPVSLKWQNTRSNISESQVNGHKTLKADQRASLDYVDLNYMNDTSPLYPVVSSCTAFIVEFSDEAAAFTKCSILYARPLRFCENCVNEYMKAKDSYDMIMEGTFHDDTGALCSESILNSDRIQIVVQTHKFIEHIWNDCHCDGCYNYLINSTTYELNNDTTTFLQLSNETMTCFDNFTHGSSVEPFSNWTIDSAVCDSCKEHYYRMNDFYDNLEKMYPDSICVDIIDMMNYTRLQWSKEFHCSRHSIDVIPIILLSIFFSSLPVLFYISNKIHGTKTEKKLLKQKRMRESQINNSVEEEEQEGS